ncbi:MAG: hypothetical protein RL367_763, partial [Pseudomonadota bacterium]
CEDLGLDMPVLSTDAVIASVRHGARIAIAGLDALTLKVSRVAGAGRLEIIGAHPARLAWYKSHGCYTEIIAYKTRLFLPDGRAAAIIDAIKAAGSNELEAAA